MLDLRAVAYGDPDAVALVARVQEEYVERYGGPDETPLDPSMFDPPDGLFLVPTSTASRSAPAPGARRRSSRSAARSAPRSSGCTSYPSTAGRGLARRILAELETPRSPPATT